MRTVSFDIPPQEILTKDSVTIAVDAVVYYKISNANGEFVSWDLDPRIWFNLLFKYLIHCSLLLRRFSIINLSIINLVTFFHIVSF